MHLIHCKSKKCNYYNGLPISHLLTCLKALKHEGQIPPTETASLWNQNLTRSYRKIPVLNATIIIHKTLKNKWDCSGRVNCTCAYESLDNTAANETPLQEWWGFLWRSSKMEIRLFTIASWYLNFLFPLFHIFSPIQVILFALALLLVLILLIISCASGFFFASLDSPHYASGAPELISDQLQPMLIHSDIVGFTLNLIKSSHSSLPYCSGTGWGRPHTHTWILYNILP